MIGHATNEGVGAAQSKTGDQATPLNRAMGFAATEAAMSSKVRSAYNASGGPAYDYVDAGSGTGGNVCGYETGNGGAGECPTGTYP